MFKNSEVKSSTAFSKAPLILLGEEQEILANKYEEEKDLDKIWFDLDLFKLFARGFLEKNLFLSKIYSIISIPRK